MEEKYTGPEKRISPRKEEKLKIEYVLKQEFETKKIFKLRSTYSVNIGSNGVCMCIDEDISLKEGSQLYLIITLPNQRKIFATCQVIYITPDSTQPDKSNVGLRYLDIGVEDKIALINSLGPKAVLPPDILEEIGKKAYELYEKRGCTHGHALADWSEAERIILGGH